MPIGHFYLISIIWLATGVLGFISLPACRLIFRFSSDRGYAFSRIIGLFSVSYIVFLAATLKLMPLSISLLAAAIILWMALNFYLFIKEPKNILPGLRAVIITEAVFLLSFSAIVIIKSFQPQIYQIERFMDFGFIEALKNSTSLPLQDIWFAGQALNYYYFGHFIGFIVLSLTGADTVTGFFLLTALIFALLAAAIYRLASDIVSLFGDFKKLAWTAGFLSIFSVLIAGTWYMIPWIFKKMLFFFGRGVNPGFFYPEPTRIIPGTITEMPIYSFLVADIHAHVWGMLSGILIIAVLYYWWRDDRVHRGFKNFYFWAATFVLGLSYMISSWDAVTLGGLSAAVITAKYWKLKKMRLVLFGLFFAFISYIWSLPWSIFNKAPIKGVGLVLVQSPLWPWLSFWGPVMVIVFAYLLWRKKLRFLFPEIIMGMGILFLFLIEIVYIKDILLGGEWYRANTVFKVTTQVWIWISIFMGPVFVWLYGFTKKRLVKAVYILVLIIYISIGSVYPVIAVSQSYLQGKHFTGIDTGLDWWKQMYPDDYEVYLFLKDLKKSLPDGQKMKTIVEAEGDSYTDASRFSVFLGWSTIVGWAVHEWTWRGSYDFVAKRRNEVREIYTGTNFETAKAILDSYDVDYIIIGQFEKMQYPGRIRIDKLKKMGKVIFKKGETLLIEYGKYGRGTFQGY